MFPEVMLPNAATLRRSTVTGEDADLNPLREWVDVITNRPARLYREGHELDILRRSGITAEAMVTFSANVGEAVYDDDLVVVDGASWEVVKANRRDNWFGPNHWEIALVKEGTRR